MSYYPYQLLSREEQLAQSFGNLSVSQQSSSSWAIQPQLSSHFPSNASWPSSHAPTAYPQYGQLQPNYPPQPFYPMTISYLPPPGSQIYQPNPSQSYQLNFSQPYEQNLSQSYQPNLSQSYQPSLGQTYQHPLSGYPRLDITTNPGNEWLAAPNVMPQHHLAEKEPQAVKKLSGRARMSTLPNSPPGSDKSVTGKLPLQPKPHQITPIQTQGQMPKPTPVNNGPAYQDAVDGRGKQASPIPRSQRKSRPEHNAHHHSTLASEEEEESEDTGLLCVWDAESIPDWEAHAFSRCSGVEECSRCGMFYVPVFGAGYDCNHVPIDKALSLREVGGRQDS